MDEKTYDVDVTGLYNAATTAEQDELEEGVFLTVDEALDVMEVLMAVREENHFKYGMMGVMGGGIVGFAMRTLSDRIDPIINTLDTQLSFLDGEVGVESEDEVDF